MEEEDELQFQDPFPDDPKHIAEINKEEEELYDMEKHYGSEINTVLEDDEAIFSEIPEEQFIEKQFMLEQAKIEEALKHNTNIEIVNHIYLDNFPFCKSKAPDS